MFLKRAGLGWACVMLATPLLHAQDAEWQLRSNIHMGLDAWHIEHTPKGGPLVPAVFMPDQTPQLFYPSVTKQSTVLELNYQHSPVDTWSVSVSQYPFIERGAYEWKHQAVSVGWRRDWTRHWYTAVQLTHAKNHVPYSIYTDFVPAGRHSASAVGLRVGFKL